MQPIESLFTLVTYQNRENQPDSNSKVLKIGMKNLQKSREHAQQPAPSFSKKFNERANQIRKTPESSKRLNQRRNWDQLEYKPPEELSQPQAPEDGSQPNKLEEGDHLYAERIFKLAESDYKDGRLVSALLLVNRSIWLDPESAKLYTKRIKIQFDLIRNDSKWAIHSTIVEDVKYLIRKYEYSDSQTRYLYLISILAALYQDKLVNAQDIAEKSDKYWFPRNKKIEITFNKPQEQEQIDQQHGVCDELIQIDWNEVSLDTHDFPLHPLRSLEDIMIQVEADSVLKQKRLEFLQKIDRLITNKSYLEAIEKLFSFLEYYPKSNEIYERIISTYQKLVLIDEKYKYEFFLYIGLNHLIMGEKIPAQNYLLLALDLIQHHDVMTEDLQL